MHSKLKQNKKSAIFIVLFFLMSFIALYGYTYLGAKQSAQSIIDQLSTYRIDIKNYGEEDNDVEIIDYNGNTQKPKWFLNNRGIGAMLWQNAKSANFKIKAIKDGHLVLNFMGPDKRKNEKRFPVWIDYESIKIDGKEILTKPVATWHDKGHTFKMPVKNEQVIKVETKQVAHEYSESELKDTILKLGGNEDVVLKINANNEFVSAIPIFALSLYKTIKFGIFLAGLLGLLAVAHLKWLHKRNSYGYVVSFVIIFLLLFVYFYKTTPYYSYAKITVTQEALNNKLYFDMGYSYKEHFTVLIKNNVAIIDNRFAHIQLIDSIAIKNKKGDFIELPFNAEHYKSYSNIYIYYQIVLSLIIAFAVLYVYFNSKNIIEFTRINKKLVLFFCLIFIFYATSALILYPAISYDSLIQFRAMTDMTTNNTFSLLYSVLATSGYILFGSPQDLILIISLFSASFFLFYTFLTAKKIHIIFAICFAILIPAFPFILAEVVITERPVVSLWTVTGLVMAIYNAVSEKPNKKIFFVSCFFLMMASMIRYDLCFYFLGALILYFVPRKGLLKATALSLIISASVVLFSMGSEKIISGYVSQLEPRRMAIGTISTLGYLIRDNLLSAEHMNRLSKYYDMDKIHSFWGEGWPLNYIYLRHLVPLDDPYLELIKEIRSEYIKKYPMEYIQSRLLFSSRQLSVTMKANPRFPDNNGILNRIQEDKEPKRVDSRAVRFIQISNSDLYDKLTSLSRKYNYPLVFSFLLYFASIVFCFKQYQICGKMDLIAVGAIFIGPLGKFASLVYGAPMVHYIYGIDIALMVFIVIPLCIPFIVNSFKRRKCNA